MTEMPSEDNLLSKLLTADSCEQFASNVKERLPELAKAAEAKAVRLRAASRGAETAAELQSLEAVYAYERILKEKHGKRVGASRTWPMIKRRGVIAAVENIVRRTTPTAGFAALAEMGLIDMSFEAVVLRHPDVFTAEAVRVSSERLGAWRQACLANP